MCFSNFGFNKYICFDILIVLWQGCAMVKGRARTNEQLSALMRRSELSNYHRQLSGIFQKTPGKHQLQTIACNNNYPS